MFAEDVGLLPADSFTQLLDTIKDDTGSFVPLMELLFEDMNQGRVSGLLRKKLLVFNGGVFATARALPVDPAQLALLRTAAKLDWSHVEPAIFGTLLERALDPGERHKLGAHYTPRSYVERLVLPTVIEPLRAEWQTIRAIAITLARDGDLKNAIAQVRKYHRTLCAVRVLDPACGSGNFLYVALEHMKRLEGEVLNFLHDLGDKQDYANIETFTVDPHQFLGLEINPRAAAIAELVLWIGYLQWHFRVHGDTMPAEPVLKKFHNIENRDAVLAYDKWEYVTASIAEANPKLPGLPADWRERVAPHTGHICVWNRKTKIDPETGREIPDPAAVTPLCRYTNPRPALWPEADFIVGTPPFLGAARMREDLGEGYAATLRAAYPEVPESADFVMYWWHKAAVLTAIGKTFQFGFITTNSIRQVFNRRVVQNAFDMGIELQFAIPDHPWIDATECAAVRIAMTVGAYVEKKTLEPHVENAVHEPQAPYGEKWPPILNPDRLNQIQAEIDSYKPRIGPLFLQVTREIPDEKTGEHDVGLAINIGKIPASLSMGANVAATKPLRSNEALSSPGVKLHGSGFILTPEEAATLGLGKIKSLAKHIRPYRNGKDLADRPRNVMVIDLLGLTADQVRDTYPKVYQHLLATVKPERDQNNRETYRKNWWLHGEPRGDLRPALAGLSRYIATVETSKHRFFQFLDAAILPDNMLIAIASDDAFHLGVLSSRLHVVYALAAGGTLEDRPRYNKTRCFDPFPFPDCTEPQKNRIRKHAEEIDAHRKRAQQKHNLALTDIYNLLEKLRAAAPLTDADRHLNDTALVTTLRHLHDELDAAVSAAYGWPANLTDDEILTRLVDLNARRAAEESEGQIRWLRPDYQIPLLAPAQSTLALTDAPRKGRARSPSAPPTPRKPKLVWKKSSMSAQFTAVETVLAAATRPLTAAEIASQIPRSTPADVQPILDTLETLARIHPGDQKGTYLK